MGDEFTDLVKELEEARAEEGSVDADVLAGCQKLLRAIAATRHEHEVLSQRLAKEGINLNALLTREQQLRDALKGAMLAADVGRVFEPQSKLLARVVHSFTDVYDPEKLEPLLTPAQQRRCLVVSVDGPAVKKLVETGALDYSKLLETGALERRPRSKALYVNLVEGEV